MIPFRLRWVQWRARFRSAGDVTAEYRLTCHCLPTDLVGTTHMDNGRYHNFLGLALAELLVRSGISRRAHAAGARPVLATSSIRFRKEIRLWQKFDVTARVVYWDDRWIYLGYRLFVGIDAAAIAIVKSTFVDKNGRVSPDRLNTIIGHTGPTPPASELIAAKSALDALLKV